VSVAAGGTATLPSLGQNQGNSALTITVDVAANARLNGGASTSNWVKTGAGAFDLGTGSGFGTGWAKEGTVIINNAGTTYAVNGGLTIGDTAQNAPAATVFIQSVVRTSQIGAGTYNRTGTLDLNNQMMEIGSAPTFVGGGTVTSSNVTSGTGLMIGNLTYNAANAFDTGALIEKVTLSLNGVDRTFTINDSAAVATEMTVSSNIIGTNGITKAGAGTLVLSGSNSYSGVTTIGAGVLRLDNANALPGGIGSTGGASALTINGGVIGLGNGDFARGLGTGTNQVQITGGGGFAAYGADRTVNLGGNGTPSSLTWGSGSFITTAGGTFVLGAASADKMVDFQNPIALNGAVRTVQVDRGSGAVDARLSGVLSGNASSHLTKTGAGVLELTAVNTYSGTTAINAGRFLVSSAGNLSNTARVVVNGSGADFRWNSSTAFTRPLTMTQGTISGTGTISASGGVSIGTNAILSPGNSPGIQAYTTSLAWAPGGTYLWELNSLTGSAGTNWDLVNATSGTFSLAGLSSVPGNQFVFDLITLAAGDVAGQLVNPYDGGSYTFAIASYNPANFLLPGGFSNTAGADLTSLFTINLGNWQGAQPEPGNIAVKVNSTATGLDLVIVPEPGAIALAGIGIAAAAYALRRRVKKGTQLISL
jgi:autotransporter-associated beta strand protein